MSKKVCGDQTAEEITGEEGERLRKNYFMYKDGVIRLQPSNRLVPKHFLKYADLIYGFQVKPSDICVNTFPKSGTTWAQEIVWNLVHNPNLDNPHANISLDAKFPTFEGDMFIATTGAPIPDPNGDPMKMFAKYYPGRHFSEGLLALLVAIQPPPRMFKNHLPLKLLSPQMVETCKVLYVSRDPRDVMASLYHYVRLQKLYGFTGTLDEFIDDIVNDRAIYGPYWDHMKDAWDLRHHPNLCFVYYEDLKHDPFGEVKKIDKFLGTNRNDQQIHNVVNHTSFSQMKERFKKNPPTSNDNAYFDQQVESKEGGFFRKGIIGDWKNNFTPEQVTKLNTWIAKHLPDFGDDFKYKI